MCDIVDVKEVPVHTNSDGGELVLVTGEYLSTLQKASVLVNPARPIFRRVTRISEE